MPITPQPTTLQKRMSTGKNTTPTKRENIKKLN
jgi:hypothetical protein